MDEKLCFVIPNYNGARHLNYSLKSLEPCTGPKTVTVLVDDASTDDSVRFVETNYPDIVIVRRARNRGFAASVNQGMKWASEKGIPYVAVFNSDVKVPRGFWQPAVNYFEYNNRVGVVGFKEVNDGVVEVPASIEFEPAPPALPGMLYICRMRAVEEIGFFDESYVMYGEESDLFDRLIASGWEIRQSNIPIWHFVSGSRKKARWRMAWYSYRNMILHSVRNRSILGIARSIAVSGYYALFIPKRPASQTWVGRYLLRRPVESEDFSGLFQARLQRFNLGNRGLNSIVWVAAILWNALMLPMNAAQREQPRLPL